jgi:hypothetical protein
MLKYLGDGDPRPAGPILHDLLARRGVVDDMLDQVLHHAGVPPDELPVRRVVSYADNLEDLLRADANVYGLGTE